MLSIIIPAFNEEKTLEAVLVRTKETIQGLKIPCEIIVIDDGSTDGTFNTASGNGAIVVKNEMNLGKGVALKRGFSVAKGDIVVTMDADGSHQPEEIPMLISPIINDGVDAVIGVRQYEKNPGLSLTHNMGNRIFNVLFRLLLGASFSDSQSGFRSFRKTSLEKLNLKAKRYDIESEMLVKLIKKGHKVVERKITCKKRVHGSTRISVFRDGFRIFVRIILAYFTS